MTNNIDNELKPCPFCGKKAKVQGNLTFAGFSVVCLNRDCGAHIFFYGAERSRAENIKRFNRREVE